MACDHEYGFQARLFYLMDLTLQRLPLSNTVLLLSNATTPDLSVARVLNDKVFHMSHLYSDLISYRCSGEQHQFNPAVDHFRHPWLP